jgi:uncharacterized phiE125 gp8 family phage protein
MPEILAPPSGEPLSVPDAKLFLRVEHTVDDALIASLIATAHATIEARTGRAMLTRRLKQRFDNWPKAGQGLLLALSPVSIVHAVTVINAAGAETTLATSAWTLDPDPDEARVLFAAPSQLPTPSRPQSGIAVEFSAGGALDAIPPALVQAVRLVVAHLYARRDGSEGPEATDIARLIAPWQEPRL